MDLRTRALLPALAALAVSVSAPAQKLPEAPCEPDAPAGSRFWRNAPAEPTRAALLAAQIAARDAVLECRARFAPPPRMDARTRVLAAFAREGEVVWTFFDAYPQPLYACLSSAVHRNMRAPHAADHPVAVFFPLDGTDW